MLLQSVLRELPQVLTEKLHAIADQHEGEVVAVEGAKSHGALADTPCQLTYYDDWNNIHQEEQLQLVAEVKVERGRLGWGQIGGNHSLKLCSIVLVAKPKSLCPRGCESWAIIAYGIVRAAI